MHFNNWRKKILNFISRDSCKTIIFINMQEHLDKVSHLIEEITRKANGDVSVVCFNSELPVYFQKTNLNLKLSEDYLTDTDYQYIDEYAINLARTWYLVKDKNGKGVTEYENIHLGSLVEYDFKQFLILHIKNFEVVKRVIDLENPHKIITMEDTGELKDVVKTVSRDNNISLLSFSNKPLFSSLMALKKRIRDKLSDVFYLSLVDSIMRILLIKTKLNNLILIDPRAHAMLTGPHRLENFIFCPIEKGLPNRLYALKKRKMYISFDTPLSSRLKIQVKKQKNEFFISHVGQKHHALYLQTN